MKHVNCHLLRLLCLLLLLVSPSREFVPTLVVSRKTITTTTTTSIDTAKMDRIAHELEELGQEFQPHVFQGNHGFNEFKESLVHKLRRAVYEKDKMFREALKELEQYTLHDPRSLSIDTLLLGILQDIQQMLQEEPRIFELAWKSTQWELENGNHDELVDPNDQDTGRTFLDLVHSLQRIEQELATSREEPTKMVEASKASLENSSKSAENDESVTRLLWHALKLTGRRVKNAMGFVLCFGRKQKARKES